MKIYMVVEIPEIDDVESQEADNALMIITDAMQHFPYPYYIDEVIADEV
jgi:hypothetical protein